MKKEEKEGLFFFCKICNCNCRDKYNYERHINTRKHKNKQNYTNLEGLKFTCDCGKSYSKNSSLYNHKKVCKFIKVEKENENELISLVKKQNEEIEELKKAIKDSPRITNNTNNINNHLNLNIFLNEKCKDAINIVEFKKIVQEAILDVSNIIELNVNDVISNAINLSYNSLDNYEKPYYTLDKSRNKVAIKDENNEWVKDNNDLIYNNLKTLEQSYFKVQLDNFYKSIKDKDNMNESEENIFLNIIQKSNINLDKSKLLNNVIENGINPKKIV